MVRPNPRKIGRAIAASRLAKITRWIASPALWCYRYCRAYELKRRWVPPAAAVIVTVIALSPIWSGAFTDDQSDEGTLIMVTIVYAALAGLFAWMRRTMTQRRRLSYFGHAIVDFFFAVVIMILGLSIVFAIAYAYAKMGRLEPHWLRYANRAVLAGGASFAFFTGSAVGWEMRKANERGEELRIHLLGETEVAS